MGDEAAPAAEAATTGRPGDWNCPSCQHLNYAFREVCQKCQTDKFGEQAAAKQDRPDPDLATPDGGKPGDWVCPNAECGHHNYAFRDVCQKCNTNKWGEKEEKAEGKKPGDWNCTSCNHLNFEWRMVCQRCQKPRDWRCPNCNDLVFASRFACRKCGTPKHLAAMMNFGRGMGFGRGAMGFGPAGWQAPIPGFGGGGRGAGNVRPGDWACPNCNDLCFASRQACRKCNTQKPAQPVAAGFPQFQPAAFAAAGRGGFAAGYGGQPPQAGGGGGQGGGGQRQQWREGDWRCPSCNDHQYASRSRCRKCGANKPE